MLAHAMNRELSAPAKPLDQTELLKLAKMPLDQIASGRYRFSVRCLIEKRGDVWQAFTLEYGLAVQGDSAEDVRRRLDNVLCSYVHDAVFGDDREHAEDLLMRGPTREVYIKYYAYRLLSHLPRLLSKKSVGLEARAYSEPLALMDGICSPC
jgi:hypothetical protein